MSAARRPSPIEALAERIDAALQKVERIAAAPGGEAYIPLINRLHDELDAAHRALHRSS